MIISRCEPAQSDERSTSQVPNRGCCIHWNWGLDWELRAAVVEVVAGTVFDVAGTVFDVTGTVVAVVVGEVEAGTVVAVVVGEVEAGTVVAVVVGEVEAGTVVAVVVGEVEAGTVVAVVVGEVEAGTVVVSSQIGPFEWPQNVTPLSSGTQWSAVAGTTNMTSPTATRMRNCDPRFIVSQPFRNRSLSGLVQDDRNRPDHRNQSVPRSH